MNKNKFGHVPQFDRDLRPGEEFPFVVLENDAGDRNDPEHCIFARCAKRVMRTDNAWFGWSVAYIEIAGEIVRCHYTPALAAAIREFEETGRMTPGVYRIRAPRPSETVEGKRAKNARTRKPRTYKKSAKWYQAHEKGPWHAPRGWGTGVMTNGEAAGGNAAAA